MDISTPITEVGRLTATHSKALERLGIRTVGDLLYHFPTRYGDTAIIKSIRDITSGETVTLFGKVSKLKTKKSFRGKIPMAEGMLSDDTGTIKLIWFSQPYLAKMLHEDALVRVDGKVAERNGTLSLNNPKIEKVSSLPTSVGNSLFGEADSEFHLYPVYRETKGITSNWIYHTIQKIFGSGVLDTLEDPIPEDMLKRYNLPSLQSALVWMHAPKTEKDALSARKRFAFEEILFLQLEKERTKRAYQEKPSYVIKKSKKDLEPFVSEFPFAPTTAQNNSIKQILDDFKRPYAMMRLLEGDVGSGKTAVAASTVYAAATTRPEGRTAGFLQTAYMVPTEVLAKQHFESFIEYFKKFPIPIALITGSECRKFPSKTDPSGWTKISKAQLKKWVANGEIPVVIGTHALIQKSVEFKDLAYVIIDEQHRFGVNQRHMLTQKGERVPHLLSMTATPIPRTLALTVYGDLDLTVIDQMPKGRKPVITEIISPSERKRMYDAIRKELADGRQAYIICPRIDEPDPSKQLALNAKSVKEEAKRLKQTEFKEYEIDILHSKMTPTEKEDIMQQFKEHKTDILCATSVVEVGVNVPNATSIIIEGAERFGLAQLHQLRGRVIRSNHQAYCYIFTESSTQKTIDRLGALTKAANGFELAEHDLKFRGPGELTGGKQAGITDIGMEALTNLKLVEAAQQEARNLLDTDENLENHPAILKKLNKDTNVHLE